MLLDVHNVFSHWHRTGGRVAEAETWQRLESIAVTDADGVMTCSDAETRRLVESHPDALGKAFTAPLGIDPGEWPDQVFTRDEPLVAMFGSWGWAPNQQGLAWFLDEVWPSVRARVPAARALVAGGGAHSVGWPEGAEFVGRVADLAAFTAAATVVCVPVHHGVGASVKFPESLATGAAVIATSDGGSALTDPPAVISDSPTRWIDWITERLEHRSEEPVPAPARERALREYTWTSAAAPIADWLDRVSTSATSAAPADARSGRL